MTHPGGGEDFSRSAFVNIRTFRSRPSPTSFSEIGWEGSAVCPSPDLADSPGCLSAAELGPGSPEEDAHSVGAAPLTAKPPGLVLRGATAVGCSLPFTCAWGESGAGELWLGAAAGVGMRGARGGFGWAATGGGCCVGSCGGAAESQGGRRVLGSGVLAGGFRAAGSWGSAGRMQILEEGCCAGCGVKFGSLCLVNL